jgi:hypothetical protein
MAAMKATLRSLLCGLLAATALPVATAGAPDSSGCRRALDTLRELEDRVLAAPPERSEAPRRQMLQARRAAALACLGEDAAAPPARVPARPETVAPRGGGSSGMTPLTSPATRPAAPVPPPALPRTITNCDSGGCWTSDGQRLQRVGPQLLGPRGFCTTAGNAVQCP